ncbi:MAG: GGDEF domain-containing protein [Spirochaetales bacterium]|nr:GGDEF domain-containing protein [Spirochaetales bacterium]
MFESRLFRRQFLALFILAVALAGTLSLGIVARTQYTIQQRELQIVASYRDTVLGSLERWLEERVIDVHNLARDMEMLDNSSWVIENAWRRFAELTRSGSIYSDFMIVDANGRVVVSKVENVRSLIDLSDRDYVRFALAGVPFVSGLFQGRQSGTRIFAISQPLTIAGQPYALAGIVSLGNLVAIVESLNLAELGSARMVARDGQIIIAPSADDAAAEQSQRLSGKALEMIRTGTAGIDLYTDADGSTVTGAWGYLRQLDLALLVELDNRKALKPIRDLLNFVAIMLVVSGFVVLIVSYVLSATMIRPIASLVAAVNDMRNDAYRGTIELSTGTELDDLIAAFNDMSGAVRDREASLRDSASRDSLTGLYNHGLIEELLARELRLKRRTGDPLCFVMFDIDHFKRVNDTYGHQAGDDALRLMASVLTGALREGDILGRYGGEEFAIILNARKDEEAASFCERIRAAVEAYEFLCDGVSLRLTASLGYVCAPAGVGEPYDIIRRADRALYEAKNAGRNMVRAG